MLGMCVHVHVQCILLHSNFPINSIPCVFLSPCLSTVFLMAYIYCRLLSLSPFHSRYQRPNPVSVSELMKQSYEMYGFITNDIIEKMRNVARLSVGQVSCLFDCLFACLFILFVC